MTIGDLVKFSWSEINFHESDAIGIVVDKKSIGDGKMNLITVLFDRSMWCYPDDMLELVVHDFHPGTDA